MIQRIINIKNKITINKIKKGKKIFQKNNKI